MNRRRTGSIPISIDSRTRRWTLLLTLPYLLLTACSDDQQTVASPVTEAPAAAVQQAPEVAQLGVAPPYSGDLDSLSLINIRDAVLERVVPPLDYPWAFEFISDDEVLLTRISGELLRINLATGEQTPIGGLPDIGKGYTQIGLLDIEIHPDFSANRRIYFSYSKPHPESGQYHLTEVATGVLDDNAITQLETLVNSEDFGWAPSNFGGVLEFDDSDHLYISMGDRGEDVLAQRNDRLEGKILRLNADGSTPQDNPFVNKPGYDPRIYVTGVRNPQGLYFDAQSGRLFETEHGPLGGDEVNILKPGANYGWPTISYGNNYATTKPMGIGTHNDGMEQPVFYFLPSIATSAVTVYRGGMFSEWEGDILVGALRGEHIAKLDFDEDGVRAGEDILREVGGRIRDIKVARDGSIFILSQTTGLYRLSRQGEDTNTAAQVSTAAAESADHPGKERYDLVCSGCHNAGVSGAPVLGNYTQWQPVIAQSPELTREHVFNGYKAMPERGLCYVCTDQQLLDMIDYVLAEAEKGNPG
jgi:glucose/arabinose dehydrogenase